MGNAASSSGGQQLPDSGEATAAAGGSHHQQQAPDTSVHSSTKSWATMDHSISGPWSFLVKEEVQCLCEGGRNCSHENPARQKAPNAIEGLHSSWVSDQVLAMARPWQDNVLKHDMVSQFKQHNIGMILNLQEVGEHESCGPGNLAVSGFTYNPETFMAAKIGVYNISWRDMGVPTLEKMMDIVQIMHYTTSVECRKVAVHCHAGLGRTGLAIACFLLASGQAASAPRAVEMVRAARPGSLQTQAQVMFVSIFEQYLQHLRCMFKVADLKQLSLGNTNYVVTKVCRRISRSMSGMHQASSTGTPDALAAAAAALGPLAFTPTGSGGSGASSAPGSATAAAAAAAAAAAQGQQPDWASATYDVLSASEAAQLAATPAEVASASASAGLNLGPAAAAAAAASGPGGAGPAAGQDSSGLVMHARRLSGGAAMKMVSNLRAIDEEGDRPVHVIQTDNAVTEVYGHGLTIIRATDSVKKMYASRAGVKPPAQPAAADQQQLTAHDLGLDKQLPWNDKFAIQPEAFKAEGWLPDPPASYLEALRRQQRLLHGQERRRCLHQHKLLRSAAKALAVAADAYNAVPAHTDAVDVTVPSTASQSPPFKRTHTRSRSNAAAIDLLAVTGSLSPCGSSVPQADLHRSPSGAGSLQPAGSGLPAAAGVAAISSGSPGGGLMSKQQQQLAASASGAAAAAAAGGCAGTGAAAAPEFAAALLPGLHLGPPGTNPAACSSSGAGISRTASGARKLARQGSSAKGRKSANSPGGAAATAPATAAGQAHGGFFLSCDGSSAPAAAAAPGSPAVSAKGGTAPSCTPLLSGCCAPSFAVGLLIALLYKGRFPEEFEAQWAGCPRLKALGLDEGHAVCQALQDVKLAVNVGSYAPLESASGAVVLCVLADWFEGFSEEAFTESTLEMLVDDAESMLAESLAAAAMARAQEAQQALQQQGGSSRGRASVGLTTSAAGAAATGHLPPLKLPGVHQEPAGSSGGPVSAMQVADEAAGLARKTAARAACTALAPFEQDMCLLLAAVLRHARHASLDDPRLQELGLNYSSSGGNPTGSLLLSSAGGALPAGGSGISASGISGSQSAAAVEAQVDAAMAVLYRLVAGWLLGPLALACLPALEAVAAFLHYLTVDDTGYGCLLQAIQQGARRARTAPPGSLFEASDSVTCAPRSNPNSPRGGGHQQQQQQQQNLDRLEKLKVRLLRAGSSFKLKPLSAYYKQHRQASCARASLPAEPQGIEPSPLQANSVGAAATGAAAQHTGIGPSKLRHASSSPELAGMQQGQPASSSKPARSKLGGSASFPATAGALTGGGVDLGQGGGQPMQGSLASPEPKQGCAASLASLLTHKLGHVKSGSSSSNGGKHQRSQLHLEQQHGEHALQSATATEPTRQQQQQEQQRPCSPIASSSCGDSTSELVHAGNCQELCVGRQGQRVQAEAPTLEDELAALTGQQAATQGPARQDGSGGRVALGVLDSPPRSVSPELSPTAAGRKHGGRSSSGSGSKQQHPLHMWLAPLQRSSLEGGGSDAGSSFTNSPCSSMGSITGLVMAAQLHQGYQLQQASSSSGAASSFISAGPVAALAGGAASSSSSSSRVSVSAAGVPDVRPTSAAVAGGELSVQSSHAGSVSAMSDLQLQSSTSKVSVSKVSVTRPTAPARKTAA